MVIWVVVKFTVNLERLKEDIKMAEEKKRKEDKGNPYPTMDVGKSVSEYFNKVEQWKKDNPSAAKELEVQQEKNRKEFDKNRKESKKYTPIYEPGKYKPHPEGEMVAKGGMIKKYGYLGGGKVYGQPRKAKRGY